MRSMSSGVEVTTGRAESCTDVVCNTAFAQYRTLHGAKKFVSIWISIWTFKEDILYILGSSCQHELSLNFDFAYFQWDLVFCYCFFSYPCSLSSLSSTCWSCWPGLDGALEEVVLEAERDGHEDEVEDEHAETHPLRHLPAEDQDGKEHLENNYWTFWSGSQFIGGR